MLKSGDVWARGACNRTHPEPQTLKTVRISPELSHVFDSTKCYEPLIHPDSNDSSCSTGSHAYLMASYYNSEEITNSIIHESQIYHY